MKKFKPAIFELPVFRFKVGVLCGDVELQKMKDAEPQLRAHLDQAGKHHACTGHCGQYSVAYFSDACLNGDEAELVSTIVHESWHLVRQLLRAISEAHPGEEIESYLVGYISQEIMKRVGIKHTRKNRGNQPRLNP